MSAIANISAREAQQLGVSPELLRQLLGKAVWAWYREHADDKIFSKRILFVSVTLRVRDVRFLIERIAGPEVF